MRFTTLSALFFAASIAVAIASPARKYYYDDDEYPDGKALIARPISLASAPFYYQPRTLEVEPIPARGRKYKVVKRKKRPGAPQGSDEEDTQDDDGSDESSEEDEEEDDEDNEQEEHEVPPWEQLFPEEDKNTGNFDTPGDSQGGGGGPLADLPGGQQAPQSSGSLLSLLTGGYGSSSAQNDAGGSQQQYGQGPPQQYGQGPPQQYGQGPQYRQGPPPYQAVRARTSLQSEEEPRSGGAVIYDGYRYIPIQPVHVRVPKRQAKKINPKPVVTTPVPAKARSGLVAAPASPPTPKKKKQTTKSKTPKYVFVPYDRDSREIRFARDEHGFQIESDPMFAPPSEVWRWERAGGRPSRRRDNRPSGLYYAPPRPHRGSAPTIRFAQEDDY